MTPAEQYRRFGCVLTDCALARKARQDDRDRLWQDIRTGATNILLGVAMGGCVVAAVYAGTLL